MSQASIGFTNRREREGYSRREFQKQQDTGSNVSVEVSRISALFSCEHCGRKHEGICRRVTGCWKCGALDHQLKDCLKMWKAKGQASVGTASRLQSSHGPHGGGQMQ